MRMTGHAHGAQDNIRPHQEAPGQHDNIDSQGRGLNINYPSHMLGHSLAMFHGADTPTGFHATQVKRRIGYGQQDFRAAWNTVTTWAMHNATWAGISERKGANPAAAYLGQHLEITLRPRINTPQGNTPHGLSSAVNRYLPGWGPHPVQVVALKQWHREDPQPAYFYQGVPSHQVCALVYGTRTGHAVIGEEAFIIDMRDDGQVWAWCIAFSRPRHPLLRALGPVGRLGQVITAHAYLLVLAQQVRRSGTEREK